MGLLKALVLAGVLATMIGCGGDSGESAESEAAGPSSSSAVPFDRAFIDAMVESELGMDHGGGDEIAGAIDVDAKFAEMMIPHHEGAITMANAAQSRAQHAEIKTLADAMSASWEIGVLQKHAGGEHHGG